MAVSIVIGGQCRRPAWSMVLPLGCGWEPPRPDGGTPETPGCVQPHSLLRESVTGGDLHRREPCFISPDEGPVLRHPRPPLGRPETRTRPRGKGDAGGALGNHEPSAMGPLAAPPLAEDLPSCSALLRAAQGGPCYMPRPRSPQCTTPAGGRATALGSPTVAPVWFTCSPWLA